MTFHWRVLVAFSIVYIVSVAVQSNADNTPQELTVKIPAGVMQCFYEKVSIDQVIDVEYQVIDGGHGDLDISFELQDPNGYSIVSEYKKSDNVHRVSARMSGDYRFCFDNSFSTFNVKSVFFELILETPGEDKQVSVDEWGREILDGLSVDELIDVKVS